MKKSYRSVLSIGLLSVLVVSLVFMLTGCGFFGKFPTARIDSTPSPTNGTVKLTVGEQVEFTGAGSEASTDDAEITEYDWTFPDEFNLDPDSDPDEEVQSGSFDSEGDYVVRLKVTEDTGKADKANIDVNVDNDN